MNVYKHRSPRYSGVKLHYDPDCKYLYGDAVDQFIGEYGLRFLFTKEACEECRENDYMFDVYCYILQTNLSDREIARETVYSPERIGEVRDRFNEHYETVQV
jgi:hypothetical protein